MPCKTKCITDVIGRAKKRPMKWVLQTENSFAAEVTLKEKVKKLSFIKISIKILNSHNLYKGKAYTKNKKPYVGLVRFDRKQCKNKVLEAIEDGRLRVDIGDQADKRNLGSK